MLLLKGTIADYEYLSTSRASIDGRWPHSHEWRLLETCLDVVGLSPTEQMDLFRIVASVLHIGKFKSRQTGQIRLKSRPLHKPRRHATSLEYPCRTLPKLCYDLRSSRDGNGRHLHERNSKLLMSCLRFARHFTKEFWCISRSN